MKIRTGFVGNSSSSSFLTFSGDISGFDYVSSSDLGKTVEGVLVIGSKGEIRFGWDFIKYADPASKLNFASLQAIYADNQQWLQMLSKVIKEHVPDILMVDFSHFKKEADIYNAYIDHQSSISEGENAEMFDSETSLKDFLFSHGSSVCTGNDNSEEPECYSRYLG